VTSSPQYMQRRRFVETGRPHCDWRLGTDTGWKLVLLFKTTGWKPVPLETVSFATGCGR